jgi:hypothetical protein
MTVRERPPSPTPKGEHLTEDMGQDGSNRPLSRCLQNYSYFSWTKQGSRAAEEARGLPTGQDHHGPPDQAHLSVRQIKGIRP